MNKVTNRFYKGKARIRQIAKRDNVDVDVAAIKYAQEAGFFQKEGYVSEMNEWREYVKSFIQHPTKTIADMWSD